MVKTTRVASVTTLAGLALGLCLFVATSPVQARTTSDQPAAILYWPKIVVDTAGRFTPGGVATDTLIRLSNTCAPGVGAPEPGTTDVGNPCADLSDTGLNGMKQAHCFYIDANSHCSNDPTAVCQSGADCGVGSCLPGWSEIDFDIVLTKEQPLAWQASAGLSRGEFPLEVPGRCATSADDAVGRGHACTSDGQCAFGCVRQQSNIGSGIPPVAEDPFVGSLVCIEFDPSANPPVPDQTASTNTLKGEATIEGAGLPIDIASYNAVGVRYVGPAGGAGGSSQQLLLDGVQYDTCPTTLILDHLFDIAPDQFTDLTLIPCGNDFLSQTPGSATAQFVVFNEFEQRFSTTRAVDCFLETPLSNLDTPDSSRSIFSLSITGTFAGQTRIHPVGTAPSGRGLIGVARLFTVGGSAAYNLHQAGSPPVPAAQPDIITIP